MKDTILKTCDIYILFNNPNIVTRMKIWRFMSIVDEADTETRLLSDIHAFIRANLDDTYFHLTETRKFINKMIVLMLTELSKDEEKNNYITSQYTSEERKKLFDESSFDLDKMKRGFLVLSNLCEPKLINPALNLLIHGSMQSNSPLGQLPSEIIYSIADRLCESKYAPTTYCPHKTIDRRYTFFKQMLEKRNADLRADTKPEESLSHSSRPN